MSRRRRSGRQETAPTSTDEERRCVGLFDRQSRHWNTKVLVMVAIIVVVAAVIRVGHYSRRMEAASRKKHDPREGHNQAKAVLRARSLSLFFPRLPIATPTHRGAMFSADVSTTPCASFRDKKYDRRSFLRRMRRPSSRNYSNYFTSAAERRVLWI